MNVNRLVLPEILDELDAMDQRAIRSRRDLRLVNWFMRGEAWILRQLDKMPVVERVVELGAGSGHLAKSIHACWPELEVVCVDLTPRPAHLDGRVSWWQGDVFDYNGYDGNTVVVTNLFLHHFEAQQLEQLGNKMRGIRALLAAEPYRGTMSLLMGRCLFPFVNDVTRHDMAVSIGAGFRTGELAMMLGMDLDWLECRGFFGGIRLSGGI